MYSVFLVVRVVREREPSSADINVQEVYVWTHILNRYNKFYFNINEVSKRSFFHFPPTLISLLKYKLPFAAEGECPSTHVFPKMLTDCFAFLSTSCSFNLPPREESHVTGRQEPREVREPVLVNDRFSNFQGTCCLDEFF